jgi:hypothetical protein
MRAGMMSHSARTYQFASVFRQAQASTSNHARHGLATGVLIWPPRKALAKFKIPFRRIFWHSICHIIRL